MSIKVGELIVEMSANVARLTQDMDRAKTVVSQRMRDIDGVVTSVKRSFELLGVGLSVGAFAAITRNAINSAAALDDMAEATGNSVQYLSRLNQLARISGAEMGSMESGLLKLSRALAGADDESKGAAEAFKAIGLSVAELKRLNADQQFDAVANALNRYADGANKTAIGQAIWGRQWRELAPLIKDYADIAKIAANVTEEQAAQAERLQKEWNALTLAAQNLAQRGILQVVSAFETLRKEIRDKGMMGAIRDILDPQSELSLQKQIADLKRKQAGAGSDKEFAALEAEIVAVQARLAEALRLKQALTGDRTPLPDAPAIAPGGAAARTARAAPRSARADNYVREVFGEAERDIERLFQERADMMEEYGVAGSKKYMKFLKEEYEFERWAQRELYSDAQRQQQDKMEAERRAAEDAKREWERTSQGITDSLTDALMRGFEGGADAAKNFVDTLKNMFASLVLRPIIQPIAQAGAGLALGALGMGSANASGGGMGAGDLFGIGSAINSITGGAGIGGAVATGLEAMGATTGIATGWGAAIGTVAPYLAVAAIAYSMLKKPRGGPKTRGDAVGSWQTDYAALVEQLGGTPGSFSPYLQYEADPRGTASSSIYAGIAGYEVIGRDVGRDEAALQAGLAEEYTRMMVAALRATDLPAAARDIFAAIDPATASAAQLADAMQRATKAQQEATAAQQEAAAAYAQWIGLARGVVQTRIDLAGGDLSALSPEARLAATRGSFTEIARRAALGEQAAFGDLSGAASGYLSAARGYYASGSGYASIYSEVQGMLEQAQNTALRQAALTGQGSVADLISETAAGNRANEAGLSAMLAQLQAINDRLAAIEATNALAAAA